MIIMHVEDDDRLRALLQRPIEARGHKIIPVASATTALQKLEKCIAQLDLLLTDIDLSAKMGPSGWDVARMARRLRPTLPVIYASARPFDRARSVAGALFLQKPFSVEQLRAALARVQWPLGRTGGEKVAPAAFA